MAAVIRRLGRWLCRYDLEPVRTFFRWRAYSFGDAFSDADVAQARAMLRILDGRDPADTKGEAVTADHIATVREALTDAETPLLVIDPRPGFAQIALDAVRRASAALDDLAADLEQAERKWADRHLAEQQAANRMVERAGARVEQLKAVLGWFDFIEDVTVMDGVADDKPMTIRITRNAAGWRKAKILYRDALAPTSGGEE